MNMSLFHKIAISYVTSIICVCIKILPMLKLSCKVIIGQYLDSIKTGLKSFSYII